MQSFTSLNAKKEKKKEKEKSNNFCLDTTTILSIGFLLGYNYNSTSPVISLHSKQAIMKSTLEQVHATHLQVNILVR